MDQGTCVALFSRKYTRNTFYLRNITYFSDTNQKMESRSYWLGYNKFVFLMVLYVNIQ